MAFIWKIWKSHYQWFMQKRKLVLSILITILVFTLILNYTIDSEEMGQVESIISKCLFCNIANGRKPPVKLLYENEEYAILKDKYPASTHHYLAIPKQHYTSLKVLNKSHVGLGKKCLINTVCMYVLNQIYMPLLIVIIHSTPHARRNGSVPIIQRRAWRRCNNWISYSSVYIAKTLTSSWNLPKIGNELIKSDKLLHAIILV